MSIFRYWTRLEPRSRTHSLAEPLAAKIRDPLWMLTRQWQFGEFQGEDGGSPAFISMKSRTARISKWGGDTESKKVPIESLIMGEPFEVDLSDRIELGLIFKQMIGTNSVVIPAETMTKLFTHYGVDTSVSRDVMSSFEHTLSGLTDNNGLDGVKLFRALRYSRESFPAANINTTLGGLTGFTKLKSDFISWVEEVYPELSEVDSDVRDPAAWNPEKLEYRLEAEATIPALNGQQTVSLNIHPERDNSLSWHAIDVSSRSEMQAMALTQLPRYILPMHLRFKGMPNLRWWDFEQSAMNFGDMNIENIDLAKLMTAEFMLVQGNDWFVIPFPQEVGTFAKIDQLIVHDVFNSQHSIDRADSFHLPEETDETKKWSMFSHSIEDTESTGKILDGFFLPPGLSKIQLEGEPLESVVFQRDEIANLMWGVEERVEDTNGSRWEMKDRIQKEKVNVPQVPGDRARYNLQNEVATPWTPFLPVPVSDSSSQMIFQEARMSADDPNSGNKRGVGRILNPDGASTDLPYQIQEIEVPRSGTRITRIPCAARGEQGELATWVARRRGPGRGGVQSGLAFDFVIPKKHRN